MDTRSANAPSEVVVGFDGSVNATAALEWAAQAAARRGVGLTIVTVSAIEYAGLASPIGLAPSVALSQPHHLPAVQVSEVRRLASKYLDDDAVSVVSVSGSPGAALVDASQGAELLVVGNRGHGAFGSAILGSVSTAVATHAHCPVVVVRGTTDEPGQGRPVTVGVDASGSSSAAVEFAADEALSRGVALRIVSAWALTAQGDWGYVYWPTGELNDWAKRLAEAAQATASDAAERARAGRPGLMVETSCPEAMAAHALEDSSRRSSLVVVGARSLGPVERVVLGSVSRAVLHHASCPVAVVRTAGA